MYVSVAGTHRMYFYGGGVRDMSNAGKEKGRREKTGWVGNKRRTEKTKAGGEYLMWWKMLERITASAAVASSRESRMIDVFLSFLPQGARV